MIGIYFVFKYWKYIVSSVAALTVGFVIAWYIQGIRIEYVKAHSGRLEVKIENLETDLKGCGEANITNQVTINNLQSEIKKTHDICNGRLRAKEKVSRRLKEIDGLKKKSSQELGVGSQESTEQKPYETPEDTDFHGEKINQEEKPVLEEMNQEIKDEAIGDDPILNELNRMFTGNTANSQD